MSNMSYCMFQNTLNDLRDCKSKLHDIGGDLSQLSDAERKAATEMLEMMADIVNEFGDAE